MFAGGIGAVSGAAAARAAARPAARRSRRICFSSGGLGASGGGGAGGCTVICARRAQRQQRERRGDREAANASVSRAGPATAAGPGPRIPGPLLLEECDSTQGLRAREHRAIVAASDDDHFRGLRALRVRLLLSLPATSSPCSVAGPFSLLVGPASPAAASASPRSPRDRPPGAASAREAVSRGAPRRRRRVDDLEDNNNQITKTNGRDGYWWSAADPKGSKIEWRRGAGRGGSELAMHINGTTVPGKAEDEAWGVLLGMNFVGRGRAALRRVQVRRHRLQGEDRSPVIARAVRLKIADMNTHKNGRHLQDVLEPLRQGPDADAGVEGIPGDVLGRRAGSGLGDPARRR